MKEDSHSSEVEIHERKQDFCKKMSTMVLLITVLIGKSQNVHL